MVFLIFNKEQCAFSAKRCYMFITQTTFYEG